MQLVKLLKNSVAHILSANIVGRFLRRAFPTVRVAGFAFPLTAPELNSHRVAAVCFGFHERQERRLIRRFISGERDVLELGSSIGVTSLEILARLKPDRRLIAVEANPSLVAHLGALLTRHGAGRAEVVPAAIGPEGAREIWFELCEQALGSKVVSKKTALSVRVPVVDLKSLIARLSSQFDLVADIEGAERWLLEDQQFLGHISVAIVELHESATDPLPEIDSLLSAFQQCGFDCNERINNVVALVRRREISRTC